MPSSTLLVIQALDPSIHERSGFDCGIPELNEYLAKRARKEMAAGLAACFVATRKHAPTTVLGYYTLSAATITRTSLPTALTKKLPKYREMPATLLGRLAVATSAQGQGLGGRLLVSAMARCLQATSEVASLALVTDPKDERAAAFYKKFGFQELDASRLFLPMKDVKGILNAR